MASTAEWPRRRRRLPVASLSAATSRGPVGGVEDLKWDESDESLSLEWMFDVARTAPPEPVPAKKSRLPRLGTAIPWGRVVGLLKSRTLGKARRPRPAPKEEQEGSPASTSGDGEQTAVVEASAGPRGRLALTRQVASAIGAAIGATAFCLLSPQTAPFLGLLAILSDPQKLPKLLRIRQFVLPAEISRTLKPFSTPAIGLGFLRVLLPVAAPSVWRGVSYWVKLLPVLTSFLKTGLSLRGVTDSKLRARRWAKTHEKAAKTIRAALMELQGFNMKLAQVVASKSDLLPPAYVAELGKLFEKAPVRPFSHVKKVIESELRAPMKSLFKAFDTKPLASGTIAQVHRAVTLDGRSVAVKVQHPDVAVNMSADIRSMSAMCRALELLSDAGILPPTKFDMVSLMREYEKQVPLEMDFMREGRVQALVGQNMQANPPAALMIELEGLGMPWGGSNGGGAIVVPTVVRELSRRRVLTSELLDGRSVHSVPAPLPDANGCLMALINALGKQIFIDGVFHSDPHPGNLLLLSTGRLALVDFGQSKELSPANMLRAASVIVAVAGRNDEQILKACRAAGLRARAKTPAQVVASAYILFDTRMDIAEAKPSPAMLKLGRSVWVTTFPQELFMVMRVVTILRGVLAKQGLNLSAAQIWRPYAQVTLKRTPRSLDATVMHSMKVIQSDSDAPALLQHGAV